MCDLVTWPRMINPKEDLPLPQLTGQMGGNTAPANEDDVTTRGAIMTRRTVAATALVVIVALTSLTWELLRTGGITPPRIATAAMPSCRPTQDDADAYGGDASPALFDARHGHPSRHCGSSALPAQDDHDEDARPDVHIMQRWSRLLFRSREPSSRVSSGELHYRIVSATPYSPQPLLARSADAEVWPRDEEEEKEVLSARTTTATVVVIEELRGRSIDPTSWMAGVLRGALAAESNGRRGEDHVAAQSPIGVGTTALPPHRRVNPPACQPPSLPPSAPSSNSLRIDDTPPKCVRVLFVGDGVTTGVAPFAPALQEETETEAVVGGPTTTTVNREQTVTSAHHAANTPAAENDGGDESVVLDDGTYDDGGSPTNVRRDQLAAQQAPAHRTDAQQLGPHPGLLHEGTSSSSLSTSAAAAAGTSSYRRHLWHLLNTEFQTAATQVRAASGNVPDDPHTTLEDPYLFSFVGCTLNSHGGSPPPYHTWFPHDHCGQWDLSASELLRRIYTATATATAASQGKRDEKARGSSDESASFGSWLRRFEPEVIVLQIGANDLGRMDLQARQRSRAAGSAKSNKARNAAPEEPAADFAVAEEAARLVAEVAREILSASASRRSFPGTPGGGSGRPPLLGSKPPPLLLVTSVLPTDVRLHRFGLLVPAFNARLMSLLEGVGGGHHLDPFRPTASAAAMEHPPTCDDGDDAASCGPNAARPRSHGLQHEDRAARHRMFAQLLQELGRREPAAAKMAAATAEALYSASFDPARVHFVDLSRGFDPSRHLAPASGLLPNAEGEEVVAWNLFAAMGLVLRRHHAAFDAQRRSWNEAARMLRTALAADTNTDPERPSTAPDEGASPRRPSVSRPPLHHHSASGGSSIPRWLAPVAVAVFCIMFGFVLFTRAQRRAEEGANTVPRQYRALRRGSGSALPHLPSAGDPTDGAELPSSGPQAQSSTASTPLRQAVVGQTRRWIDRPAAATPSSSEGRSVPARALLPHRPFMASRRGRNDSARETPASSATADSDTVVRPYDPSRQKAAPRAPLRDPTASSLASSASHVSSTTSSK